MAGTSWYVSECKDCEHMNINDVSSYDSSKSWCKERREYVDPYSRACSNRFKNDDVKNPPSSDCYITTIICEILGQPDNSPILNTLRVFREEVLKKDKQYHNLLCEYDLVGPIIAEAIRKSLKPDVISKFLLETYIEPTVDCVIDKKYDLAIIIYKYMVEQLKSLIGVKTVEYDENIIPTGKGYIKG